MKRKKTTSAVGTVAGESGRVARVQPELWGHSYETQLQDKLTKLKDLFADVQIPEIEIFPSPVSHYRLRCEFRVFHDGDESSYMMFESDGSAEGKPKMTRKETFPVASRLVNGLMQALMDHVRRSPVLRRRLYTAAFHTTLSGEAMITLVYHKVLEEEWKEAAEKLSLDLAEECEAECVHIIGRSRKQKVVIGEDFVTEKLTVHGQTYSYRQVESCFTQPNGEVCQQMLSWAQSVSAPEKGETPREDLLELYCGNCNFTIPLAENFRRVIATEVSRTAVEAGRHNLKENNVDNVLLARMSSEEFVKKWQLEDLGRRLEYQIPSDFDLSTIFVDPPRAGLDAKTIELLKTFDKVLYISCNPSSLYANIKALIATHTIHRIALFDQFPYSGHLECGVYLHMKRVRVKNDKKSVTRKKRTLITE